jgi:hypothetical protein
MTIGGSTVPRMCGGTLGTPTRHDRFSLDGSWNRIHGGMDGVATVKSGLISVAEPRGGAVLRVWHNGTEVTLAQYGGEMMMMYKMRRLN